MLSKNSVSFDVSDCTLREESEEHSTWSNANGVYIVLRVPKVATNWSFDLHDVDAATKYFSEQSIRNGGVLLQMDVVTVGGRTALRRLFKYRSPLPQSLGMMFVSILWIRLPDTTVQINVESVEQGITGAREAAVFAMTGEGQAEAASNEPVLVDSIEELFADMGAQPLRVLPSDDSRYDDIIPDHPLSRVRQRMAQVEATLSMVTEEDNPVAPAKAPWWKFW